MYVTGSGRWEDNVLPHVELLEGGGVYNGRAPTADGLAVARDRAAREAGQGVDLFRGEVGLLKTNDVVGGGEVVECARDRESPIEGSRVRSIVGKTIDVVGEDSWRRESGGREWRRIRVGG